MLVGDLLSQKIDEKLLELERKRLDKERRFREDVRVVVTCFLEHREHLYGRDSDHPAIEAARRLEDQLEGRVRLGP